MKSAYFLFTLVFIGGCTTNSINGVFGFENTDSRFIFEFYGDKNCKWVNSGSADGIGAECELESIGNSLYQIYNLDYRTGERRENMGTVEYFGKNNVVKLCIAGVDCVELPYIKKSS